MIYRMITKLWRERLLGWPFKFIVKSNDPMFGDVRDLATCRFGGCCVFSRCLSMPFHISQRTLKQLEAFGLNV